MRRYMLSIAHADEPRGTIVTVDAPTELAAFEAVVNDQNADGDVVLLGTCSEIYQLARKRGSEKSADYRTTAGETRS